MMNWPSATSDRSSEHLQHFLNVNVFLRIFCHPFPVLRRKCLFCVEFLLAVIFFWSHAIIVGHVIGKFSRSFLGEGMIKKKTGFLLCAPALQCVLLALSYWSKCVSQTNTTRDLVKGTTPPFSLLLRKIFYRC